MSEVGWLAAGGEDVTAQFHELFPVVELEHLKAFEVLTVPGIFTAWYPRYFAAIERGLRPLRVRRSRVDTEGTVEDNAGILASEIRAPTIVVAQSKGPLDVHAALWMYPSAARNVRAFVSLQGCFSGTPLASDARRTRLWRAAVGGVTRLLGSTPRAYWDMTYERRQALLARIPQHSPVPTVSLVTVCARAGPLLERTRRYLLDVHRSSRMDSCPRRTPSSPVRESCVSQDSITRLLRYHGGVGRRSIPPPLSERLSYWPPDESAITT